MYKSLGTVAIAIMGVFLLSEVVCAMDFNVKSSGFGYSIYDIGVNKILKGPVGKLL